MKTYDETVEEYEDALREASRLQGRPKPHPQTESVTPDQAREMLFKVVMQR